MSDRRSICLLGAAALACAVLTPPSSAGTISLAWSEVDHPDLAGYRVYFDTAPDTFGDSADAGPATQLTLGGLADCTDHFVAVKAYDSTGVESHAFSETVSGWARPSVTAVSPSLVERNAAVQLVVSGANFQPGATVLVSDPSISVGQVATNGCHELLVDLDIGPGASAGPVDIQVINPDQVFGIGPGLLSVVADDTGPGISSLDAIEVSWTTATIAWITDEPSDSRVFFRLQGESLYQSTPVDATLVSDHEVQLRGLAPESTYEYYVQSTDASGNSTVSGAPVSFTTPSSPYTYVRFEAEDGESTAPIVAVEGAGVFEGRWIEVPEGTPKGTTTDPAGTAVFGFHVPHAATWHFWVRIYGTGYQNDGWFEAVDGAPFDAFWTPDIGAWHWVQVRSYDLAQGLHTMTLGGLESEARADRFVVTDDPEFVPTEQPGDDTVAPDAVTGLVAGSGDGVNVLSWTNPADTGALTVSIRYRIDGLAPLNPADGLPLMEAQVVAGSPDSVEHTGLSNGTAYTYSVFVLDAAGNASEPRTVEATPSAAPPPTVENLMRTDAL